MEQREKQTSWLGRMLRRWAEPELQRTTRLLRLANGQLDHALRENIRLKDQCDSQEQDLVQLRSDNRELKAHIQRLEEGNKVQLEINAKMESRLSEMERKYEHMLGNYMRSQAQQGLDITPPIA